MDKEGYYEKNKQDFLSNNNWADGSLILDEPMNGLGSEGVAAIRKLLLKLKEQGRLIILASHNREDIDILCDVVFNVEKGQVTCEDVC